MGRKMALINKERKYVKKIDNKRWVAQLGGYKVFFTFHLPSTE